MHVVKGQGYIVGSVGYLFISFSIHTNLPCQFWDTATQKLTLNIEGQGHGQWKS